MNADQLEIIVDDAVQRMAMHIAELPIDVREGAIKFARKIFEETMRDLGQDPASDPAKNLIDQMCDGIRTTMALMAAPGRA